MASCAARLQDGLEPPLGRVALAEKTIPTEDQVAPAGAGAGFEWSVASTLPRPALCGAHS